MRGIIFTLAFLALFLLLLSLTLAYAASVDEREAGLSSAGRLEPVQRAHDNLASVYRSFLELSGIAVEKNSTFTSVTIQSRIPSSLSDANASLAALEAFLEGTYANTQGLSLELDQSRLAEPFVYFDGLGLNYSSNSTARTATTAYGSAGVTAYMLAGSLSDSCSQPQCNAGGGWAWTSCGPSDIFVSIDILDSGGTPVKVNGSQEGCVSSGSASTFTIEGANGGSLAVTVGNVSGSSPAVRLECYKPLFYDSSLTVNVTASAPTRAWLPVLARVDGSTLQNIILVEK